MKRLFQPHLRFVLILSAFFSLNAGRAAEVSDIESAPKPIRETTVPYVVAVLDRVTVQHSDGSKEVLQVSQDGMIDLDGKSYSAKGLAPDELQSLVRKHVSDADSVRVEEFRTNRVTVLGEVFHQTYSDMGDGPMRVLDAIAAANGFTPLANARRVKLLRENAGDVQVYELDLRKALKGEQSSMNILVEPGDVITVPRNFL